MSKVVELGYNQIYLWPDWFTGTWNCIHLELGGGVGSRGDSRALSWEILIWRVLGVALETYILWGGSGPYLGLCLFPLVTFSVAID